MGHSNLNKFEVPCRWSKILFLDLGHKKGESQTSDCSKEPNKSNK
jgi:hypothetical protein